jgi:porin
MLPIPIAHVVRVVIFAFMLLFARSAIAGAADDLSTIPGLHIEAELVLDSIATLSGGASKGNVFLGKSALTLELDSTEAGLWKGGRVLVQVLGTFGDDPSALVGDLQVSDNIEASDGLGILEAWVEQSFGERVSLLAGYHDMNRELDVIENAAELLNISFGIGPEISQIGPSIFPKTHLGARLAFRPTNGSYIKLAGYDGLTCEAETGGDSDGPFFAAEAGWGRGRVGSLEGVRIALGAWTFSPQGGHHSDGSPETGEYVLAEATYAIPGRATAGAFIRAGRSSADCYPIRRYTGGGLRLGGFLRSRPDDVLSLGVARAGLDRGGLVTTGSRKETTFELTWVARLRDWLVIQPDLQYVDTPAGTSGVNHAFAAGIRLILTY